jgi:hypothetical protein
MKTIGSWMMMSYLGHVAIIDALLEQLLISTKGERTPKKKKRKLQ